MSLNHAQAEAVAHKEGPCMVLAGPGSGKTLTIAKRIEYLIRKYKVRPEEILVITFTKYAAKEMKERTRRLLGEEAQPVTFGTFHGIYYGILKWAYSLNQANLLTEEEKYGLIRQAAAKIEWEELEDASEEKENLQDLAIEIGNVKNNCLDIKTYESIRFGADPEIQRRRKRSLSPQNPLMPEQVYQWLDDCRLTIEAKTGVRVFHDYLQSRQLQNRDFPALLALEQRYCRQEPYISLGRYIHVMARKPIRRMDNE